MTPDYEINGVGGVRLGGANCATGKIFLSVASGRMMRPWFSFLLLMYAQIFFVTSVRGRVAFPQMAARSFD